MVIQVDPEQVWLRDLDTDTAYFPDSDGSFKLKESGVRYYQELIVEGPAAIIPTYTTGHLHRSTLLQVGRLVQFHSCHP